jgi:hypothetical protein
MVENGKLLAYHFIFTGRAIAVVCVLGMVCGLFPAQCAYA